MSKTSISRICSIDGCGKPRRARGWCQGHYSRWRRHGHPEIKLNTRGVDARERFEANVELIPFSTCHYWTGNLNKYGYGQFYNNKVCTVHRYAYQLYKGEIPEGLHIRHSCHERSCVNPAHLTHGTHQDNMDDRNMASRQARGESDGNAKLTEKQVLEIRELAKASSHRSVARMYNVARPTVSRIINRTSWRHI